MPKRVVTTQVYEIASPAGVIRVVPDGSFVHLEQMNATSSNDVRDGTTDEIVLDLHSWLALCNLRDTVKPKRKRAGKDAEIKTT